jgi:hypothetical protein
VDADEAWSETFLSALRAYPSLPADANVEAWLVTIAHGRVVELPSADAGGVMGGTLAAARRAAADGVAKLRKDWAPGARTLETKGTVQ